MAHHSNARILAVDSSPAWFATMREATADQAERITIEAIDLGALGDWGYPTTYRHRFRDFVHVHWQHGPVKPDLVLIDGRFRVACFLHTLLASRRRRHPPSSSTTTPTASTATWCRSSAAGGLSSGSGGL